jgi:hypothetical protein
MGGRRMRKVGGADAGPVVTKGEPGATGDDDCTRHAHNTGGTTTRTLTNVKELSATHFADFEQIVIIEGPVNVHCKRGRIVPRSLSVFALTDGMRRMLRFPRTAEFAEMPAHI